MVTTKLEMKHSLQHSYMGLGVVPAYISHCDRDTQRDVSY